MTIINTSTYYPVNRMTTGASSAASTSSEKTTAISSDAASNKTSNAIADFLEYQKMTPEEKMRDAILKKLGLTEEQLASLSPEERAKVEEKIKELIKEEIENNMAEKGVLIDLSA